MTTPRPPFLSPRLAAAALAFALYAITLGGTWVYDDAFFARDDPRLTEPGAWRQFFSHGYFEGGADHLWRPLVSLSFVAQARLHGTHAWPFHLVNVLLHAAASAMVASLAYRLAGRRVAYVAGLLFAAHPVHVEAVAYMVGRAESLAAIGVLGGLLLVVRRELTTGRAVGVVGCFLLAVFSKEHGLFLPMMLLAWGLTRRWGLPPAPRPVAPIDAAPLALDYAPRARAPRAPEQRAMLLLTFLLTGTMAAYIAYRDRILPWYWERAFLEWSVNPIVRSAGVDRLLFPVELVGRYVGLLIAPVKLAPDYGAMFYTPRLDRHDPFLYLGVAALLAWVALAGWAFRRRRRGAFVCLACLGITFVLPSNVTIIGTVFGERLMYLPSAFFCVLTGMALGRLPNRWLAPALSAALLAAAVRVETYAWQFRDALVFYRYAVREQPLAVRPYRLLAAELHDRGDEAGCRAALAGGRAVAPETGEIWTDSAEAELAAGNLADAERYAQRGFHLLPSLYSDDLLQRVRAARVRAGP